MIKLVILQKQNQTGLITISCHNFWNGNGKPPCITFSKQPRTCLQAEHPINQLLITSSFSFFFHSQLLYFLILYSLDGVPLWYEWCASISVFHFSSANSFKLPYSVTTYVFLLLTHSVHLISGTHKCEPLLAHYTSFCCSLTWFWVKSIVQFYILMTR